MTYKLKTAERMLVLDFLNDGECVPQRGGHLYLAGKKSLREKISVYPAEFKAAGIKDVLDENKEKTGHVEFSTVYTAEIKLESFEDDIIKDNLKSLAKAENLHEKYLRLYEIFVEGKE